MELDELKKIWKQQDDGDKTIEDPRLQIKAQIDDKMRSLEQKIRSRDRIEIIAAVIVMLIFGFFFFYSQSLWTKVGSGIVVLSAIYICYKLKAAQIKEVNTDKSFDQSMDEHLKMELKQVQRQKKLLQNVAWWYIAPMTIGLIVMTLGSNSSTWFKGIYLTVLLIFTGVVWKLNQRSVKRKFDPLEKEIKQAINFLKGENS